MIISPQTYGFEFKWEKLDRANFSSRNSQQAEIRIRRSVEGFSMFPEVQRLMSDADQA